MVDRDKRARPRNIDKNTNLKTDLEATIGKVVGMAKTRRITKSQKELSLLIMKQRCITNRTQT